MNSFQTVSIKKSILYFFGLNIFIFLLVSHTDWLYHIFHHNIGRYIGFLIILGVTLLVGRKDIFTYTKKIDNSWLKTIKIGAFTYATTMFSLAMIMLVLTLLGKTDFMDNINHETITLKQLIFDYWLSLPFNVVSEEFYKLLSFIGLFTLLSFIKNKKIHIIFTCVLGSLFFGLLHSPNYNLMYALVLGTATIPTYAFFVKYKSVYPLIIEHFLLNFINFGNIANINMLSVILAFISLSICIFSLLSFLIYLFRKVNFIRNS